MNPSLLTERERQVYDLLGHGHDKHDVARQLGISVKTVETYRERIIGKFNLASAAALLRHAVKFQLDLRDMKIKFWKRKARQEGSEI